MKLFVGLFAFFLTFQSFASSMEALPEQVGSSTEVSPQVNPQPAPQVGATSSVASVNAEASEKLTGTVDLRPSFTTVKGEVHSENFVDLGYVTGNWHFQFEQDFNTNLYNPEEGSKVTGLNFEFRDALFRIKRANLWQSDDKALSLSYELRPFLPTYKVRRDAGMITAVRNYVKFDAKVSDSVTLSLWEIPIAHLYNTAGTVDSEGKDKANPGFENRVYLLGSWNMTDKWSLFLPLNLNSSRNRAFNSVAAGWSHYVWTQPELMYAVDQNYSVGLSWYNNPSFMADDLSGFQISEALKDSVTQIVFHATL